MATTLDVATFSQIMTLLTQLSTNYTNIFTDYYNIFINPEPMDITLQFFDEDGALHEIVIPNRAKDRTYILNGSGDPSGSVTANRGSMYQDITGGAVYINIDGSIGGWSKIIEEEELATYIRQGGGSPEGIVEASKGILYIDNVNSGLYIKTTATGDTGWALISANTATLATINLDNLSTEGEAHFANPSLSNLDNAGTALMTSKEDRENKILNITNTSDNTQYPSARATYTFVTNAVEPKANRSMDNLTLTGELQIATQKKMRDCVLLAPSGPMTYSGNVVTLPASTIILCANGLDEENRHSNTQVTLSSSITAALSISANSEGVLFYDSANNAIRFCDEANYYRQDTAPAVPAVSYAVWYNTNDNIYHYKSGSNWIAMTAAEIGRLTMGTSSNIVEWNPFYPVSLVTKDELESFTKRMVTQASTTFEYTPDGKFVKNDVVFVDSLNTSFNPSATDHPDAVWLYSSPVYPYVPMNLTNSGTSYSFTHGGMVVCKSATNVTIGAGELSPVEFIGFVGVLPVAAGTNVTTNIAAYFVGY